MDIQSIKTFMYVAKHESFSKAAQELNYAQSTVTMQLQRLEKELGFPLFERIGRKNYLTPAGTEFLSYAEQILQLVEQAGSISYDLRSTKGIIKIGILESLLFSGFLSVIASFKKNFPNIDVNIKIGHSTDLMELLKQNKLDIIYISTDKLVDPALNCCFKNEEELVFAASVSHPLTSGKNLSAETIFDYSFVVTEPTGYCYKQLNKISTQNKCFLKQSMVINSVAAVKEMLLKGDYIAFLPKYALMDAVENKELTILSTKFPKQTYYTQILCAKNKWLSPFIKELIDEIKKSYNR